MSQSKKANFTRHRYVDEFVRRERERNHHIPHSVCLLILSPRGDQVGLVSPVKAHENAQEHVLVPPQIRMSRDSIKSVCHSGDYDLVAASVSETALVLARAVLNRSVRSNLNTFYASAVSKPEDNMLIYLGSTRGDNVVGEQRNRWAKHVHWAAVRLSDAAQAFRSNSSVYFDPQWCQGSRLQVLPMYDAMSMRKSEMVYQAILAYAKLMGEYTQLARAAQAGLERRTAA